jgi:hypothetical protein
MILNNRIGVVSPLFYGSTAHQRLRAFQEIMPEVYIFDSNILYPQYRRSLSSIDRRLKNGPISYLYSFLLRKWVDTNRIKIIWFDKQIHLRPELLDYFNKIGVFTIFYSHDDQFNVKNQSIRFAELIVKFNLVVTTKSYNVHEYNEHFKVSNVLLINNAADPSIFFPKYDLKKNLNCSFIGFYENDRYNFISELSKFHKVNIFSNDQRWYREDETIIKNNSVWDAEYNNTLNSTNINLCFLRKENRDLQTTRSIEVPMSGNLMLAERTSEHLDLFKEGVEADFFTGIEELISKVEFYTNNTQLALSIGKNGRARCMSSGYTWKKTLKTIMNSIQL